MIVREARDLRPIAGSLLDLARSGWQCVLRLVWQPSNGTHPQGCFAVGRWKRKRAVKAALQPTARVDAFKKTRSVL
jgi:hypothetical protein